jgi:hypothetical protein
MALTLKHVGRNQTELSRNTAYANDIVVFLSYETPVAAFLAGRGYFRTTETQSRKTSKHINRWLGGADAQPMDPEVLAALLD